MRRSLLIIFLITLFLVSCNFKKSNTDTINTIEITDSLINLIDIDDVQMINNIREYCDKNMKNVRSEYALFLTINIEKMHTISELHFELNLFGFIDKVPSYYALVDDKIVFVRTETAVLKRLSVNKVDIVLKKAFPKQYDHYTKTGYHTPPITYSCEKWRFNNNKFTGSEMH